MTRRTFHTCIFALAAATLSLVVPHTYAETADEALDALKESFRQRYPELVKLKRAGEVGETWEGYVAAVKNGPSEKVAEIVKAENLDRQRLYKIIAAKEATESELVARRNAVRNFENAESGTYLKTKDGQWRKKA